MCTAVTYKTDDFYFGRTFDYEFCYNETVVVTPRNFTFNFLNGEILKNHYSFIGIATIAENYPLYYDAVNEKGLAMAISKKIYGNKGNFNEVFKKWVPDEMYEEKLNAPSTTYGSGVVIASGRYPWGSGQADRAVAQLERVSGHSIDDLTKLFAEGLVMCEKSFVDRLIERNAELEARLVKEKK